MPPHLAHNAVLQQASLIRNLPPVDDETGEALDFEYQTRAETLLAVDDQIEAVVKVGAAGGGGCGLLAGPGCW